MFLNPWLTIYFAIGLGCSTPLLTALDHSWTDSAVSVEDFRRLRFKVVKILGQRGCGKTTLARALSGQEHVIKIDCNEQLDYEPGLRVRLLEMDLSDMTVILDDVMFERRNLDFGRQLAEKIQQTPKAKLIFVCGTDFPIQCDCWFLGKNYSQRERTEIGRNIGHDVYSLHPIVNHRQWLIAVPERGYIKTIDY